MFFVLRFIKIGVGFPCGYVMFMRCFLLGLSLGVAIGLSATSCGHPMATTSGHSMATSTGDRLNIFLHEICFVFLLRSFVLISFWVCSFHMLLSVGSFTGGCHWGVTKGGHWDAPEGYQSELSHKG